MELNIILKKGKEKSLNRYHLWVFSGAIQNKPDTLQDGDIVRVLAHDKTFLAKGHYQNGSIMVRIISFKDEEINETFWKTRMQSAIALRKSLGLLDNPNTNAFRLFHGEGDLCPGLIIDFYKHTFVIQAHSVGVYLNLDSIVEGLKQAWSNPITCIYLRSELTLKQNEGKTNLNRVLFGNPEAVEVLENGQKFEVDILEGQKTGFFIDQRDNRQLLQHYSKGKKVMNLFGYTGGFSVYALAGEAKLVHTIDISAKAIEQANKNIALNNYAEKHEGIVADGFEFLKNMKEDYDIMVLDPPAFAKHKGAISNAREAYIRLNKLAFDAIKTGGIIFTFSCSQVISREMFRSAVFTAAAQSGRSVKILHQLTQPADHPVNLYHPETEYLKGLVLFVE